MKNKLIYIIIGIIIGFSSAVIAESIQSNEVLYDNSNSSSNKENVQDALDNLYNIVDTVGSGYELVANNTTGLSTQLIGGLYRYQGVQDANNNVDNYICFGTTNKSTCTGDTDKYMYRIIGINTNGQMKLIKKEALNTAYKYSTSTGVDWPHSNVFYVINGTDFLTNTTYIPDNTWSNRIVDYNWLYGDVASGNITASELYNIESNYNNTITAKIGLLYLYDLYYGLSGNYVCSNTRDYTICRNSWILLAKSDSQPPTAAEFTMSRVNNTHAWTISDGYGNESYMTFSSSVRPVFFLRASERIASGSGTITDPYILSA